MKTMLKYFHDALEASVNVYEKISGAKCARVLAAAALSLRCSCGKKKIGATYIISGHAPGQADVFQKRGL